MNKKIQISAIIPAYNSSATICRAIDSVLSQTEPVTEIIVVNDGSKDDTAGVLQKYGKKIRYYYQENAGVSSARNLGIKKSRCQWIAFLDADDEWLPDWVSKHREIIEDYPNCMWSSCNFDFAYKNAQLYMKNENDRDSRVELIDYFFAQLNRFRLQTSGFLIHREVFEDVGMFNTKLSRGEDLDLWSRIAMRHPKIGYNTDTCFRCWLDNINSLTRTKHSRAPQLKNICDNLLLAQSIGQEAVDAYYPYARKRAISYIFRAAAQKAEIDPKTIEEAKKQFPLTLKERLLESSVKILPSLISKKLFNRFVN